MAEIRKISFAPSNNVQFKGEKPEEQEKPAAKTELPAKVQEVKDEFVKIQAENGWIRKIYDKLKNKTGFGVSSNDVKAEIDKFASGEISQEEVSKKIEDYRKSQYNFTQTTGDVLAGGSSLSLLYLGRNYLKRTIVPIELGCSAIPKELHNTIKSLKSNKTFIPVAVILGGLTGSFVKGVFGRVERIGSKEFNKPNKEDFEIKRDYKREKDFQNYLLDKQRWADRKSGFATAALAPLTLLGGGFIGIPLYLLTLAGKKYINNKNDENDKSLAGFIESFKDNAAVNTIGATMLAIPAFKKARFSTVLGENAEKVVKLLKDVHLKNPDGLDSLIRNYNKIENAILNSDSISKIINDRNMSLNDKITKLTNENIFAVKMLQIKYKDDNTLLELFTTVSGHDTPEKILSKALQEDCPRTFNDTQVINIIKQKFGDKYEFPNSNVKCLGVGTIAETYLAKNKATGKNVCIKLLKDGITIDKVTADKNKLVALIKNGTSDAKLTREQRHLIANIDDLYNSVKGELDFVQEMTNAEDLAKHTKLANVVKGIEAKEGAYVMECAQGISLKTLVNYFKLKNTSKFNPNAAKELAKLKAKSPDFEEFELTTDDINTLIKKYEDIYNEQFLKIEKNGKVAHGDIHPGNIFVDLKVLKGTKKGKLFTLIDTGNVIRTSREQAMHSLKIKNLLDDGNVTQLAKILVNDADYTGLSKEKAIELVKTDLKEYFFNKTTKIEKMNTDNFYTLAEYIMGKHDIILNDTQLNLFKSKTSCKNSYKALKNALLNNRLGNITDLNSLGTEMSGLAKDSIWSYIRRSTKEKWANFVDLYIKPPIGEIWTNMTNPNRLKKNSTEYIIYKTKQQM